MKVDQTFQLNSLELKPKIELGREKHLKHWDYTLQINTNMDEWEILS